MALSIRVVGSAIRSSVLIPARSSYFSHFRFSTHERLSWGGGPHPRAVLLKNLETALKSRRPSDALESFLDFKKLYGLPEDSLVVHRLISELCYSPEPLWLRKAHDLVLLISKENPNLLGREILSNLCLSLARNQLTTLASEILVLMLKRHVVPPTNVLRSVALHMVKTEAGTILVSSFTTRLCESFSRMAPRDRDRADRMRPDTAFFNLVLYACARLGLAFRGEKLVESMARIGVAADAHSIIAISRIHEMNGQRDELRRYKPHVDRASPRLVGHYRQFYDSLLSLHFKFDDIESAAELARQLRGPREPRDGRDPTRPESFLVPIGPRNLRDGLKIEIRPEEIQKDSVFMAESRRELVNFRDGKLGLSDRALARLVGGFKRARDPSGLSSLLLEIRSESFVDVIEACVRMEWLGFAHDVLDETEGHDLLRAGRYTAYVLLLAAYFKKRMLREAKALVNQMRKTGTKTMLPDKLVIAEYLSGGANSSSASTRKSDLVGAFLREATDEKKKKSVPSTVYEMNSSVRFFCKAKMMEDAVRAYRRMQSSRIGFGPTVETFGDLASGFSSLEMYREITFLWGDAKRGIECGNLVVSRDLYEYLLVCFIRGGYFERVMEVIDYMSKRGMFMDKSMYRSEFLKLHHNLYRKLKASEARTEAQRDRLRYVLAFRKWAGIE